MKPVTCQRGVERLMDYLEGALSAPVRAALEAHVAGCPRCRAFIASYRETPRILRDATERVPTDRQRRELLEFLRSQRNG
jgi:anti-sigma factor RsiW